MGNNLNAAQLAEKLRFRIRVAFRHAASRRNWFRLYRLLKSPSFASGIAKQPAEKAGIALDFGWRSGLPRR
jgi:hypothetical protein